MINSFSFEGPRAGTKLLVFGAIHGDELCGPKAVREIIRRIEEGDLPLIAGSVTFVPICNPKAHEEKVRARKENLNRIFHKSDDPQSEEAVLANELCALVDSHDALLDIHSSFVSAPSNLFVDYPDPENLAFADALQAEYQIYDWPKVYEDNEFEFPAWTTDRYAHEAGKIGILVECGKHDDPNAEKLAENFILRSLAHFGLIASPSPTEGTIAKKVYLKQIFRRDSMEDRFTKTWTHLEFVHAGTVIAVRRNGTEVIAKEDSYIIFPKDYALPGREWFYLASA